MTEERQFGWSNMFVAPEDDPRSQEGYRGERAVLVGYLDDYRKTLELKCAGLDAEQLARRSVEPSTMSLLGLIRHLAGVEHYWFRIHMAGYDGPRLYRSGDDRDEDFNGAVGDPEVVREAWETWRAEVAFAEEYVAAAPDMGFTGAKGDELRGILVHMIEEYARHMGHADLLRERIDGRVGQ
ncbi:DinB family protein [Hamadaea sp. NPDC050747]|uniref:DinB family protein n=1 Tax=Hamadaea sp. NPDC050747 TaxID=3155789 RepID=UPI0033D5D2FC